MSIGSHYYSQVATKILSLRPVISFINKSIREVSCTVQLLNSTMDIVTVKNKFQIVIPQHIREQVHIEVGDFLEAGVADGKITFTPKSLVDRHLAEGLEDARKGRTHGPYETVEKAIAALDARAKRRARKRRP